MWTKNNTGSSCCRNLQEKTRAREHTHSHISWWTQRIPYLLNTRTIHQLSLFWHSYWFFARSLVNSVQYLHKELNLRPRTSEKSLITKPTGSSCARETWLLMSCNDYLKHYVYTRQRDSVGEHSWTHTAGGISGITILLQLVFAFVYVNLHVWVCIKYTWTDDFILYKLFYKSFSTPLIILTFYNVNNRLIPFHWGSNFLRY